MNYSHINYILIPYIRVIKLKALSYYMFIKSVLKNCFHHFPLLKAIHPYLTLNNQWHLSNPLHTHMVSNIRIYHFCRITCITLMILLRCAWGIKWCLTCINSTSNVIRFLSVVLTNYFRSSWPLVSCKHKIQHLCCLKQINTDLFILSFLTEKKTYEEFAMTSL